MFFGQYVLLPIRKLPLTKDRRHLYMKKSLITLAIIASLTTLTGCGSSSSSDPVIETGATTLSGTAAKGIILNGVVTARELASDGSEIAVVGTSITDEFGQYELELTDDYQGGVVKVTISAGNNTTMKCDATIGCGTGNDFGSTIALTEGFSLDAIIQPEADDTNVSVQITPLTHMAAARALDADELNADSVASAISEVNQIAGVNIMNTEVVDITSVTALASASNDAKQLALFNTGLADVLVAGEESLQENLMANLDGLASSFEDGEFTSDDAVTITSITDAVTTAMKVVSENSDIAEELTDSMATVEENIYIIENLLDENGGFDPEPSDNAGSDEIEQAKGLLVNARTFIEKIDSDFTEPLDALSIDAGTVKEALNSDSAVMTELLGVALSQTITHLAEQDIDILEAIESSALNNYTFAMLDESGESIGTMTATFSSDTSGISITLNGSLTGEAETVDITDLTLATNLTAANFITSVDGEETLLNAITASSVSIKLTGFVGNEDTSLTLNDIALTLLASEEITLGGTVDNEGLESKISGASFIGDMTIASGDASYSGDVEIALVGFADSASGVPLSLQKIEVNGEFNSADKGSFSAGAKLEIDNAASFDTLGYLDSDSDDFETASYFVEGSLTVTAVANVPELPEATVIASVSRTELDGGDVSIVVSYDGQSFTLAVDSEDLEADAPEATVTLTNPDGVKLIVNLAETESGDQYLVDGSVFVGETQVGTVEETDSGIVLVRYTDGTFESLY